jgi:hypothetical protein
MPLLAQYPAYIATAGLCAAYIYEEILWGQPAWISW